MVSKKVILLILDGWGLGKHDKGNAIYLAKTPFIDSLYKKYPWTTLCASGKCVGLPSYQVGNSEAGHLNLGAGRIIDQDVVKISKHISTGLFFKNTAFVAAVNHVKKNKSALHLMGMLSDGQSPHSDPDHLLALLTLARNYKIKKIFLHLFTDGRDSPQHASLKAVMTLEKFLKPNEKISSIIGRFFAMDRKKAWERTFMTYEAITAGKGHQALSPQDGIESAYNANITDEFIEPIIVKNGTFVADNDAVIFFNLRSDRARQLTKVFVQEDFNKKNPGAPKRKKCLKNLLFAAMTDFGPDLDSILTAFPSEDLKHTLPMALNGKKQLYISENEKYAHVTFFFNGGYDHAVGGEVRFNVPSPAVKSYDLVPEMSTKKIVNKIISSLGKFDFICANIACPDMIGHTGNMQAGIKSAEAVDKYVKKIVEKALSRQYDLIITADHGNLDSMLNLETGEIVTEHTTNPVPFILVGKNYGKNYKLKKGKYLANVAPTILNLFGIKKPKLMSANSLLVNR